MELYEAWQRRRFRKFRGLDPFRASGELKADPRITPGDVVVEDNMLKAHELHPVGSLEYKQAGRRPPDAVFQIESPEPGDTPQTSNSKGPSSNSFARLKAFANGVANGSPSPLVDLDNHPQPTRTNPPGTGSSPARAQPNLQEEANPGWTVHQNAAVDDGSESLGATRHILRDFQEQLQNLRAQIALLSTQNGNLKRKLLAAETDLDDAAAAKAQMEKEIAGQQDMLKSAQGDLRLTKNRESRLQRLQDSLKQLMEEKDAKLSNESINSRAVVERTNALKSRIEALERQLAAQQMNGTRSRDSKSNEDDRLAMAESPEHPRGEGDESALMQELQRLRLENVDLLKQLQTNLESSKAAANEAASRYANVEAELLKQQGRQLSLQKELEEKSAAIAAAAAEAAGHATGKASALAAAERAEAALAGSRSEHEEVLARVSSLERSCQEAVRGREMAVEELQAVEDKHTELLRQKDELERQHGAAVSVHGAAAEQLQQQLSASRRRHEDVLTQHRDLTQQQADTQALLLEADRRAREGGEKLEAAQKALEAAKNERSELQEKLAQAESVMQQKDEELVGLMTQHSTLQSSYESFRKEHSDDLAAARSSAESLEGRLRDGAAANNDLREQLDEAEARQQALEGQVADLHSGAGSLARDLAAAEAAHQAAIEGQERAQVSLQLRVEELSKQLHAEQAAGQVLSKDLLRERSSKGSAVEEAASIAALLAAERRISGGHAAAAGGLREQLAAAKEEIAAGKQDLAAAEEALAAANSELASTNEGLAAAESVLASTNAELAAARQDMGATRRGLTAARAELATTNETLAAEREALRIAKEDLTASQRDLAASKEDLVATQQDLAVDREAFRTARDDLAAREGDLAAAKLGLTEAAGEVVSTRQTLAATQEELAAAREEASEARQKLMVALTSVDEEQAVTRGVLQEAQGRGILLDQLRRELAAALAEADHFEQQHEQQHGEHARAAEEWEKKAAALRAEIQTKEQQCTTSESAAQAAIAEAGKLRKLLQTAKEEASAQSREADSLQRQLETATSAALAAKEAAAGLDIDLANAKDRLVSQASIADSARSAAETREREHEDELITLQNSYSEQISGLRREAQREQEGLRRKIEQLEASSAESARRHQEALRLSDSKLEALSSYAENQRAGFLAAEQAASSRSHEESSALRAQSTKLATRVSALESELTAAAAATSAAAGQAAALRENLDLEKRGNEQMGATLSTINSELARALAERAEVKKQHEAAAKEAAAHLEAAQQLRSTLNATHTTHQRTVADMHAVIKEMREAPERDHAALSFELWRLVQENDMLRARVQEYESDVKQLINTSQTLGHANPKQKLQYHLRWKQDLEELRNECTLLLRERFQLEQCVRYLAVRCGLSSAVERDVTASRERTPLDKLQPASLVSHYKFAARKAHITDAAGDHIMLEDLADDDGSPAASEKGSASTALSAKPDQAVEQQILARVAFVCNPPPNKLPENPLRPSLTPGALLALPTNHRSRDAAIREWNPTTKLPPAALRAQGAVGSAKPEALRSREQPTPPESSAGSFSDAGSLRDESLKGLRRESTSSDPGRRLSESGSLRNSFTPPTTAIPKPSLEPAKPIPAAERLSSRLSRAFSGRKK